MLLRLLFFRFSKIEHCVLVTNRTKQNKTIQNFMGYFTCLFMRWAHTPTIRPTGPYLHRAPAVGIVPRVGLAAADVVFRDTASSSMPCADNHAARFANWDVPSVREANAESDELLHRALPDGQDPVCPSRPFRSVPSVGNTHDVCIERPARPPPPAARPSSNHAICRYR